MPYNQRPWAWKETDLENLWRDIVVTRDRYYESKGTSGMWAQRVTPNGDPHFFGAFVFLKSDPESLEVVDGQQRLTAVSMVISVLRDVCQEIIDTTTDAKLKTETATLRGAFDKWLFADPRPGESRVRLLVDPEFVDLFDALVASAPGGSSRQSRIDALKVDFKQLPIHRALRDGFHILDAKIRKDLAGTSNSDRYNFLVATLNVLEQAFICVWSIIAEEAFAFQVFGCLNARGEPLSEADKVKSELFTSSEKLQHKDIVAHWREVRSSVRGSDIGEFLRRRHIALIGPCTKAALFRQIRDVEIQNAKPLIKGLTAQWKADADLVRRILDASGFRADTKDLIHTVINTLGVKLAWIPILSGAKKFLPADEQSFHELCRLTLNYAFRERTIGGRDTPQIEDVMGQVARKIAAGDDPTVVSALMRHHSPDPSFESAFGQVTEGRPNLQFYILNELEKYLSKGSGLGPLPHSPKQHIEHILPQTLSGATKRKGEWSWIRGDKPLHRALINRLGNLCILESDINQHVSNFEFDAKRTGSYPSGKVIKGVARKAYKDSVLKLASELTNAVEYPDWTQVMIEKRQKQLAKYALQVWKL